MDEKLNTIGDHEQTNAEYIKKISIKEKKYNDTTEERTRHPDFLFERKVSHPELQKRNAWYQKTQKNLENTRNRTSISREVKISENFNGLYSARFSKNADIIATTFGSGAIQIRNGTTGELRVTLRSSLETSFPVMCCRFNTIHSEIFYASSACGNIFMCKTNTNEFLRFIKEPKNEVNSLDVSIGGEYLVSAGKDAGVRIYDTGSGRLLTVYKKKDNDIVEDRLNRFHNKRIFASRFHHNFPELIVTGGWDDTIRIWDIRVGSGSIRHFNGPHICGDAIDMFDTNIITGSWAVKEGLQVWDIRNAQLIDTINPQNRTTTLNGEYLYVVRYFDDDPYGNHVIVGGSGICDLEIIDLQNKKVIGKLPVKKAVVALDSSRSKIVFGGMEGVIRVANFC